MEKGSDADESRKGYVYILLCGNGEYYVGSTIDIEQRLKQHQTGWGCGFTKAHLPLKLVYQEEYPSFQEAFNRERQLHKWSHQKKQALVTGDIALLKVLSKSKG